MSSLGLRAGVKILLTGLEKIGVDISGVILGANDVKGRFIFTEETASSILVRDCEICWSCGECLSWSSGTAGTSVPTSSDRR